MGSLDHVRPVGAFPFDDGRDPSWRIELDEVLRDLAQHVYEEVRFPLAIIGSELGIEEDAADFAARGVPAQRWNGFLVPDREKLVWYPPNQAAPLGF